LITAAAVHLGFGAAFVSDPVAWATTAYATALCVLLAPRDGESAHFSRRLWVRVPLAFTVGGLTLALLRGPLLFDLPGFEFVTTGHTPYVVFPASALSSLGLLWFLERLAKKPARTSTESGRSDVVESRR
jgi:hypothetical protein